VGTRRNDGLCVKGCGRPQKPDAQRCAICTAKGAQNEWRRRQTAQAAKRGPAPVVRGWNYETDGLIEEHMRLAKALAWKVRGKIPSSSSVDVDDMVGDALLGLVVAGRTFDESYSVPFGAWASTQIRGAIWDGVRRWTHNGKQQYVELHGDEA
jgi:DNA-directed RNA polymerase specialized sigma subunit